MRTTLDIIMAANIAKQNGQLLWVADSGHEWLIVSDDDLADLSLKDSDFSEYSYKQGEWRALEGDCDAAVYMNKLSANVENVPPFMDVYLGNNGAVRNWPRMN